MVFVSQDEIAYVKDAKQGRLIEGNYALYSKGQFIAQGNQNNMLNKCKELSNKGLLWTMTLVEKQTIKNTEDAINGKSHLDAIEAHIAGIGEVAI
jgi:hypothetical protein